MGVFDKVAACDGVAEREGVMEVVGETDGEAVAEGLLELDAVAVTLTEQLGLGVLVALEVPESELLDDGVADLSWLEVLVCDAPRELVGLGDGTWLDVYPRDELAVGSAEGVPDALGERGLLRVPLGDLDWLKVYPGEAFCVGEPVGAEVPLGLGDGVRI